MRKVNYDRFPSTKIDGNDSSGMGCCSYIAVLGMFQWM